MTSPTDPGGGGGDSFDQWISSLGNDASNLITGAANKAGGGFFGPITTMFASFQAKSYNTANQIINTMFYGGIALGGFLLCGYGLYALTKDITGVGQAVQGASGIVGVAKKAAELMVVA